MDSFGDDLYDLPMDADMLYDMGDDELMDAMDMLYNEYGEFMDPYGIEDTGIIYDRIPVADLVSSCVFPILLQTYHMIAPLLGLCFINKLSSYLFNGDDSWLFHLGGAVLGCLGLQYFFQFNVLYLLLFAYLGYILLVVTSHKCKQHNGVAVSAVCVVYLLTCELLVVKETEWHQIRGAQMILAMKIISLAFDMDSGEVKCLPNIFQYSAYVLHVGTVIFGPWISYNSFVKSTAEKYRTCFNKLWFYKLIKSVVMTTICILFSTCFTQWLIVDHSWKWIIAYRDAQSFRFSSYFIGFLSEVTMTISGLGGTLKDDVVQWESSVVRPSFIEIPRSLVEVVTYWNLPMHHWLKTYVFKSARPLGTFFSILLTYAASALLHGINFQLAAVLLSLGFYSYVEYMLRHKLSKIFDCCILAKKCKPQCGHKYSSTNPLVFLVNLGFGCLTVFHLAYLGLMFDNSSHQEEGYTMSHTLGKWSELNYLSHWVMCGTFVFYKLI